MKKIVLVILIFFFTYNINAQTKQYAVNGGIKIAFPTGDFSSFFSPGIGLSAVFENKIRNDLNLTGTLGYLHFGGDHSSNAVLLLAGVKYYFLPANNFYVLSQLGIHFFNNTGLTSDDGASSKFAFALGGGYELPVVPNSVLDFSIKFMIMNDANYFGLRAGYKFNF